jgi:NAD(P)-dependent dehydrogenase (short-subunit alcohol dehydrogenase family)
MGHISVRADGETPMKDVEGKVAVITGGASGIGFGIARVFLRNGMKVIIADNSARNLDDAARQLGGGAAVHLMHLDVADRAAMLRAADEAELVFGKLHVLCNNAGVGGGGSVDDPDFADWDWLMSINFGGVVNGVKAFVPKLKAHGEGGHVVNTSSMAGITPLPNEGGAYTTSKFAVRGLTESLRLTLAVHKIGVSLLCPGLTRTRILQDTRQRAGKRSLAREGDPEAMFNTMEGAMDPLEVGEATLNGLRRNDPYILPHGEFKDEVRGLFEEILAAFPDASNANPVRVAFEDNRRRMTDRLRTAMPRG